MAERPKSTSADQDAFEKAVSATLNVRIMQQHPNAFSDDERQDAELLLEESRVELSPDESSVAFHSANWALIRYQKELISLTEVKK